MAEQKPRWRFWSQLGLGSMAWLAVFIFGAAAMHRADVRVDLTPHGQFSLQSGLTNILEQLDREIDVIALWPRPSDAGPWQPTTRTAAATTRPC